MNLFPSFCFRESLEKTESLAFFLSWLTKRIFFSAHFHFFVLLSSGIFLFIKHDSCNDPKQATVQWWNWFDQLISSQTPPNTFCSLESPADICISAHTHTRTHTRIHTHAHTHARTLHILWVMKCCCCSHPPPFTYRIHYRKVYIMSSHSSQWDSINSPSTEPRPLRRREKQERELKHEGRRGNDVAEIQTCLLHTKGGM